MKLTINNNPADGVGSPGVAKTGRLAVESAAPGKTRPASGENGDHVEISSVAENISAAISAQELARASQVTRLGALYSSGNYAPDSAQTSAALLANSVGRSTTAGAA